MEKIYEYILKIVDKISVRSVVWLVLFGVAVLVLWFIPSILKDWNQLPLSSQFFNGLIIVIIVLFVVSLLSFIKDFKKSSEPPRDHAIPPESAYATKQLKLDNIIDEQKKKAASQFNRGIKYLSGEGGEKNAKKAFAHFESAAEQENADAQFNLGVMYAKGEGITKDEKEAIRWFTKAAEQEDAHVQNILGWMYAQGKGVRQDDEEAVRWYQKAAEKGNAYAQGNLAVMYANGAGVPQDDEKAMEWYQKAVQQFSDYTKLTQEEEQKEIKEVQQAEDSYPLYSLGYMYAFGEQVTQDHEKAAYWLTQASQQGYIHATRVLELLKKIK